jgi:hypothetical protein
MTNETTQESINNTPAFPCHELYDEQGSIHRSPGITTLDYFIAHAPVEPQPWFKPNLPTQPNMGPEPRFIGNYEDFDEVSKKFYDSYIRRIEEHKQELHKWSIECEKIKYTRWPVAWAVEQMKARKQYIK